MFISYECIMVKKQKQFWFRFTILHSHGNAVDLGQMSSFYLGLGNRINCNIFSYDYSGYGVSSGWSTKGQIFGMTVDVWMCGLNRKF